jgi:magnesium-transporting ATPase (P-type)
MLSLYEKELQQQYKQKQNKAKKSHNQHNNPNKRQTHDSEPLKSPLLSGPEDSSNSSSSSSNSYNSMNQTQPIAKNKQKNKTAKNEGKEGKEKYNVKREISIHNGQFELEEEQKKLVRQQLNSSYWGKFSLFLGGDPYDRATLYGSNAIKSTRYEWYSFLPKNLFEQLNPWSKPANFYFLCIAVLQSIPSISTTQGRPSILVPLLFVLIVSAVKDAIEDWGRRKQDNEKNNANYKVYRDGKYKEIRSKDLYVGDLILVEDAHRIPADCLLISSALSSYAYVDTKNLDGETNLKPKTVPNVELLQKMKQQWKPMDKINLKLTADPANGDMREWNAYITDDSNSKENINLESFLLGDCILRNTPWIVALVVYCGEDSKIRQNMAAQLSKIRYKETTVFKLTKKLFAAQVIIQLCLCFIGAVVSSQAEKWDYEQNAWYLDPSSNFSYYGFLHFWTWFILCTGFVPISLYVSLELVQFIQAKFIEWDKELCHTINGQVIPAGVNTSRLNEELANVSYIFSDKTGTVTQNSMVFRKCIIGAQQYGKSKTEAGIIRDAKLKGQSIQQAIKNFKAEEAKQLEGNKENKGKSNDPNVTHVQFDEKEKLLEALKSSKPTYKDGSKGIKSSKGNVSSSSSGTSKGDKASPADAQLARDFLYALALNNTVFPKIKTEDDEEEQKSNDNNEKKEDKRKSTDLKQVKVEKVKESKDSEEAKEFQGPASELDESAPQQSNCEDANEELEIELDASSPDEAALCAFAKEMGFELFSRADGVYRLRVSEPISSKEGSKKSSDKQVYSSNKEKHFEDFEEVCMIDFNSKRKRMTVVLRPLDENGKGIDKLKIYCKGADSAVKELLEEADSNVEAVYKQLEEYGGESLRTLVIAGAEQPLSWFDQFKDKYESAQRDQGSTEKGHNDGSCSENCKLCTIEEEIENAAKFSLLGATGIEDKLQEGVADCLADLKAAGICCWLLTGDNVSTAINIGISCNLLDAEMESSGRLFVLDKDLDSAQKVAQEIKKSSQHMKEEMNKAEKSGKEVPGFGLALHGNVWKLLIQSVTKKISPIHFKSPTLYRQHNSHSSKNKQNSEENHKEGSNKGEVELVHDEIKPTATTEEDVAEAKEELQQDEQNPSKTTLLSEFLELALACESVIACRLEPKEKADMLEVVKVKTRASGGSILAIGDGNNDTPMIKTADIGVGIQGVEGTSAVAASDYSIAQFRFLTRLILVHGRLNYRRICTLINYMFYKSSIPVWTFFFLGIFSQFSGQVLYLDWAFQLHNVVYTALPILVYAIYDRDLQFETLLAHPHIYQLTKGRELFNTKLFVEWMLLGICQAALCFFIPVIAFGSLSSPDPNGQSFGLFELGMVIYTAVVLVINLKLAWIFKSWTWLHHLSLWGSILAFFICMCIFSASPVFAIAGADYYYVFYRLAQLARYWLVVSFTVGLAVGVDFLYTAAIPVIFNPSKAIICFEADRLGKDFNELMQKSELSNGNKADENQYYQSSALEKNDKLASSAQTNEDAEEKSHSKNDNDAVVYHGTPSNIYRGSNFSFTPNVRWILSQNSRSESSRNHPVVDSAEAPYDREENI